VYGRSLKSGRIAASRHVGRTVVGIASYTDDIPKRAEEQLLLAGRVEELHEALR